jgi:hypothetical protein
MQATQARKLSESVSSQPDTTTARALTRADLAGQPVTVIKDEGEGAARLTRHDLPGGAVVLKEWAPRGRLMRWWARTLLRREIRHYRLLSGTPGIPRFRGHEGDTALLIDYVDGQPIRRQLPRELLLPGLDDLERVLDAVHARRFVHLDLHQKLNALIDGQGHAWLVDLGQGLDCSRGLLRRLVFPALVRVDRAALLKFRARYAPETFAPEARARMVARHGARRDRWTKRVGRALRRLATRDAE